jgi:hypothetical protein
MEDQRERGERVAGRILFEAEAVGVAALIGAVVAPFFIEGDEEWFAVAAFFLAAALAFGLLANAVLRR